MGDTALPAPALIFPLEHRFRPRPEFKRASIRLTLEGNLTADPEHGTSETGTADARLTVAVKDRRFNEIAQEWEDAGTIYHGDLRFGTYTDELDVTAKPATSSPTTSDHP